ncbi:MAG: hypothetical protein LBK55_00655 [Azoarcus sp.]|jgi:hypothetical protein|nr:hypothetical protein [Azoarcus sp.]
MKKKKTYKPFSQRSAGNDFVRGALVSGIVAAVARDGGPRLDRAAARTALQGGVVLAAVTMAADALQRRRYFRAALAAMGAVASVHALQRLLPGEAPPFRPSSLDSDKTMIRRSFHEQER